MPQCLLKNSYIYIHTSVTLKGGVTGVLGVVVTHLIQEARQSNGDLAAVLFDLTNSYSSILYKLVETVLLRHHVPENICNLIMDYYNNFSTRVSSGQVTVTEKPVKSLGKPSTAHCPIAPLG